MSVGESNRPHTEIVIFGLLLLSLNISGCEVASSSENEHHHEHHSHDQPRATFSLSVVEIQRRAARFTSDQVPTDTALHESKRKKLLDVCQCLPELAANSDLKKSDWDRVVLISKELLRILQPPESTSQSERAEVASQIQQHIAALEQMIPLSDVSGISIGKPSVKD